MLGRNALAPEAEAAVVEAAGAGTVCGRPPAAAFAAAAAAAEAEARANQAAAGAVAPKEVAAAERPGF